MGLKLFMGMPLLLLLLWCSGAVAGESANLSLAGGPSHLGRPQQIPGGEIATLNGAVYKGVVVRKVFPDGLLIAYAQADGGLGIAKLKFIDLSDALQRQFGYSSTNAAAFEKAQIHEETRWRAKLIAEDEIARSKRHQAELADAETRAKRVGTGFFITDNGFLLTCFHVVTNATSIEVGTTRGVFPAELVQSDPARDVALLKVTGAFDSLPLGSTNGVWLGEPVFTIGFPNPDVQGWQPKLTRGEISGLSGIQDDPDEYQISVPAQPGNSGGALLDERGNVVGMVAARLSDQAALASSGMTAQNVNYAIKTSCARALINSVTSGPLPLKPPGLTNGRNFEDVVRSAQDALALILVQ